MPKKGHLVSEETRRAMSEAALRRKPRIIGRYGITQEIYDAAVAAGQIWCSDCKRFRESDRFYRDRRVRCKECAGLRRAALIAKDPEEYRRKDREAHRKSFVSGKNAKYGHRYRLLARYGVTPEWYDARLSEQEGHCALCPCTTGLPSGRVLFVDHDHATGKARGLLCARCNIFIGVLESNPTLPERSMLYLALHAGDACLRASS